MLDFFPIAFARALNQEEFSHYKQLAVKVTEENLNNPETFDKHQYYLIDDLFDSEHYFVHLSKAIKNKIYNITDLNIPIQFIG